MQLDSDQTVSGKTGAIQVLRPGKSHGNQVICWPYYLSIQQPVNAIGALIA